MSSWDLFGLHSHLKTVIQETLRFDHPTDVQTEFLKYTNTRNDVLVASKTGSGKTFCYILPILNSIFRRIDKLNDETSNEEENNENKKIRQSNFIEGLIFVPTRDLAVQVHREIKQFLTGKYASVHVSLIIGGIYREKQLKSLKKTPSIVVSTPGRLWDFVENEKLVSLRKFAGIKFLVLDEIDRIIELGQFKELTQILNFIYNEAINEQEILQETAGQNDQEEFVEYNGETIRVMKESDGFEKEQMTPKELSIIKKRAKLRRTFVISATLTKISSTSRMLTNRKFINQLKVWKKKQKEGQTTEVHPKVIDIMSKLQTNKDFKVIDLVKEDLKFFPSTVTIQKVKASTEDKIYFLHYILKNISNNLTMIFVNSINTVRKLKNILEFLKVDCVCLHSRMRQSQRMDKLQKFEAGKKKFLITTDVGARGLDIKNVDLVIHYHTPKDMDTFVHRCGRTARAENIGKVIIISDADDQKRLNKYVFDLPKDSINVISFPSRDVFAQKKLIDSALAIEKESHYYSKEAKEENWVKRVSREVGFDVDLNEFTEKGRTKPKKDLDDGEEERREKSFKMKKQGFASKRANFEEMFEKETNKPYNRYSSFLDSDEIHKIMGSLKRVKN